MTKLSLVLRGEPILRPDGVPRAKARARAVPSIIWKGGTPEAIVKLVTPGETRDAEKAIVQAFRRRHPRHKPIGGCVMLSFTAYFPIPKSFKGEVLQKAHAGELYVTKKPDKDNIEKLLVDALNGIAFTDDCQIQGGGVKLYSTDPRVVLSLRWIPQPATPAERKAARPQQDKLPLRAADRAKRKRVDKNRELSVFGGPKVAPDISNFTKNVQARILDAVERDKRRSGK